MFKKKNIIEYSNHDGKSFETAIVITGAKTAPIGVNAEYDYVALKLGVENIDWKLIQQSLFNDENGNYDVLEVETKEGTIKTFYFNIAEFFDKY